MEHLILLLEKMLPITIATMYKLLEPVSFILGDEKTALKSEHGTAIRFILKESTFPVQFVLISDELEEEMILGVDAFQR